MSVVQPFYRSETYDTLRTTEDADRSVFWCHMHANLAAAPGRACFSTQLVDDILDYQRNLGARLRLEANLRRGDRLPHVVLASDNDAFNLGGDLELFCQLIRKGDRPAATVPAAPVLLAIVAAPAVSQTGFGDEGQRDHQACEYIVADVKKPSLAKSMECHVERPHG